MSIEWSIARNSANRALIEARRTVRALANIAREAALSDTALGVGAGAVFVALISLATLR